MHLMKAAAVDNIQCRFSAMRRVYDVGGMLRPQATDVFDATWRENVDPETLPMAVHALQDEFDVTTFHQFSDRSWHVLSLNSNALGHTRLRLLHGLQTPSSSVNMTEMKHDAVQHRERLRLVSHKANS